MAAFGRTFSRRAYPEISCVGDCPGSLGFDAAYRAARRVDHPTQKPVELMRRPILNHTKRGEGVYDPFLGSGTTLAAAELAERACYGIELDPKYVDVVCQRWQGLTGKQAVLEGDGRTFAQIASERHKEAA
jgi:DNA modification methylase